METPLRSGKSLQKFLIFLLAICQIKRFSHIVKINTGSVLIFVRIKGCIHGNIAEATTSWPQSATRAWDEKRENNKSNHASDLRDSLRMRVKIGRFSTGGTLNISKYLFYNNEKQQIFFHSHHQWKGIGFTWKMTFGNFIKSLRFQNPWVWKNGFHDNVCLSVCFNP